MSFDPKKWAKSGRRGFLARLGVSSAAFAAACTRRTGASPTTPTPERSLAAVKPETQLAADQERHASRPAGSIYLGAFAAPKLEEVRCAFIGVGARGVGHVEHLAAIEGTRIVGICDLYEDLCERAAELAKARGHAPALYAGDPSLFMKMLAETRPDAVFIATPWEEHARHCIAAMRAGAHAFVEVPMAPTLEEIWSMVDTAEATKRHCMMMENVCYGREELLYLHLCRLEKLGELLHGEAAYIHDLRKQMHEDQRGTGSWRTAHYARRNGNLYPTHGLGPVAQYMSLGRGKDNFARVVSLSSPARGRTLYRDANFPSDHPWHKLEFRGGDLNTSIVQTTQGKTIMVQWDETSPRPYTRHNLIQGTRGILAGFPPRYAIEGEGDTHTWQTTLDSLYQRYEHPLYARVGPLAEKMGGHGGMDFLMLFRIIECLRHGLALDQNVYEGAWWSALGPLSEASVALGGMPQTFPDFSRGLSADTPPLGIV